MQRASSRLCAAEDVGFSVVKSDFAVETFEYGTFACAMVSVLCKCTHTGVIVFAICPTDGAVTAKDVYTMVFEAAKQRADACKCMKRVLQ